MNSWRRSASWARSTSRGRSIEGSTWTTSSAFSRPDRTRGDQRAVLKSAPTQYQRPSIWSNTSCTLLWGVGGVPYADHVDHTQNDPGIGGSRRMGRGSTVTLSPCENDVRSCAAILSRLTDTPSDWE